MRFDTAVRRLEAALKEPLPGCAAHDRMAPRPPREWPPGFNPARVRRAAGLVLVFDADGRAALVLTVRTDRLGRHGGQVSLPGGVVEPGETFEQAALREAHEEVGLPAGSARVLGMMTPVDIPVSGFRLYPVVAATDGRPRLTPSDAEVACILDVPIDVLTEPATLGLQRLVRDGRAVDSPAFVVDGFHVWGATAMILAELLVLLGWEGSGASST